MREIGGYIQLDRFSGQMLHDNAVKLNCARNALKYAIKVKKIKKMMYPKFMCDSNDSILLDCNVDVRYYSIGMDFKPILLERDEDEWLYVVNYYGQLTNDYLSSLGDKIIVDNVQAYYQSPIDNVITIYSCRKFFGVSDGAILYINSFLDGLQVDESFDRMQFLLGRFERSAEEFYQGYVDNNYLFQNEPIKKMSSLTDNILHAIDYDYARNRRTQNYEYLRVNLERYNLLSINSVEGAFMYPLMVNEGKRIRKELQKKRIYIPLLWPEVLNRCAENEVEYSLARDILPLPIDQRYDFEDMKYMLEVIKDYLL